MKDFFKQKAGTLLGFSALAAISALTGLLLFGQSKSALRLYNTPSTIQEREYGDKEESDAVEMQAYTDEEASFSVLVPREWTSVKKDGCRSFIQKETGASIQFKKAGYDPSVNNASASSLSRTLAQKGYTFVGFTRLSGASYELLYQDKKESIYDYIEEVYWDRETVITITCIFKDADYAYFYPYYEQIIRSFSWERKSPVPDGYHLFYRETGDYEVGIPDNWATAISGDTAAAREENTGATLVVKAEESSSSLESLTAAELSAALEEGRENLIFGSFQTSAEQAYARSSYSRDGKRWINRVYLFFEGGIVYSLVFDYEEGSLDETMPGTCADLFRISPSQKKEASGSEESATSPVRSSSESDEVNLEFVFRQIPEEGISAFLDTIRAMPEMTTDSYADYAGSIHVFVTPEQKEKWLDLANENIDSILKSLSGKDHFSIAVNDGRKEMNACLSSSSNTERFQTVLYDLLACCMYYQIFSGCETWQVHVVITDTDSGRILRDINYPDEDIMISGTDFS